MKSSIRVAAVAVPLLALSLFLKVAVHPAWAAAATAPTPRTEVLRQFLATATGGAPEEIAAPAGGGDASGWRFRSGACQAAAFPSGPRGSLDLFARSHARRKRDQIAYVYRGEFRTTPPVEGLAVDVIVHRLTSVIRPANEPGYVVLIYPKACAAPTDLPWSELPVS